MGDAAPEVGEHDWDIRIRDEEKLLRYEIHVETGLDQNWSQWFDGMDTERVSNNQTRLVGHVEDQAALHGVLIQVRDLGLEIISVTRIDHQPKETP